MPRLLADIRRCYSSPEPQVRGSKRVRRDFALDGIATSDEEGPSHNVTKRLTNRRKSLDISKMEVIPAMFNRLTWFIKKDGNQSTAATDNCQPKTPASSVNPGADVGTGPAGRGLGRSPKANKRQPKPLAATSIQAQPEVTTPSNQGQAQRGRKRTRSSMAQGSSNDAQPGPIIVQPNSPPAGHNHRIVPVSVPRNGRQPTESGVPKGRKILVPTRVSERLKNMRAKA